MKFLKFLGPLGWLIDPIAKVAHEITKAKQQAANAKNEADRISADERVRTLEIKRDEIARDPFAPIIRAGFAFPFFVYINKLVLWDKVLELGSTDPLKGELPWIMMAIISFYFLSAAKQFLAGGRK